MKKLIKKIHVNIRRHSKVLGKHITKHQTKYIGLAIGIKLVLIGFSIGIGIQMFQNSYAAEHTGDNKINIINEQSPETLKSRIEVLEEQNAVMQEQIDMIIQNITTSTEYEKSLTSNSAESISISQTNQIKK